MNTHQYPVFMVYTQAIEILRSSIHNQETEQTLLYAYIYALKCLSTTGANTFQQVVKYISSHGSIEEGPARRAVEELVLLRFFSIVDDKLWITDPSVKKEPTIKVKEVGSDKVLFDKLLSVTKEDGDWNYLHEYLLRRSEKERDVINGISVGYTKALQILHVFYIYEIRLKPKNKVLRQAFLKIRKALDDGYTYRQLAQCVENVVKSRGWWYDRALEWTCAQFFQNNNDKIQKLLNLQREQVPNIIQEVKKLPDWKFRVQERFCEIYHGGGRFEDLPQFVQDHFYKELSSDSLPHPCYEVDKSLV